MLLRSKIPCFVLVYDQVDIVKQSLEFFTKYANKLDIIVIENPSKNTPEIKKLVNKYGERGLITKYCLFNKNVTSNAYDIVLNDMLPYIKKHRFVLVSDGDLVVENKDWLKEELAILKSNQDVFACGITLDDSNLPHKTFPDAKEWIPPDFAEHKRFFEALTGCHLLLFRSSELDTFMSWKNKSAKGFVDGVMHSYCYDQIHKKWARTKKSKARHLTWDLYQDTKNPYTKLKTSKSFKDMWYHNDTSDYSVTKY